MRKFMKRIALLFEGIFTARAGDNAVQIAEESCKAQRERIVILSMSDIRSLLKVLTDEDKSVEERKAEARNILSSARIRVFSLLS